MSVAQALVTNSTADPSPKKISYTIQLSALYSYNESQRDALFLIFI